MTLEWVVMLIVGGFISATTTATMGYIKKLLKGNVEYREKQERSIDHITNASKCLLRDRILQAHNYHMNKGGIDTMSLESIMMMYRSYTDLGGNSFVTDLVNDLKNLKQKGMVKND